MRGGYQGFGGIGTGVGNAYALDKLGSTEADIYTFDLTFQDKLSKSLGFNSKLYFYGEAVGGNFYRLPPGTFKGLFPNGVRSVTQGFVNTSGLTTQLNYTGIDNHRITVGTGFIFNWLTKGRHRRNFIFTPTSAKPMPLTDVYLLEPGLDPQASDFKRYNFYTLIQDEWKITNDLYLTSGFRYDFYSDIKDSFSPRASLIWNISPYFSTKLIYNRAFRPPGFFENRRTETGNPLKPEVVNTVEFQIENRWSPRFKTSANIYWFGLENKISSKTLNSAQPLVYFNTDTINGEGFESEINYQMLDNLSFTANYSYHRLDKTKDTGYLPEHMAKGLINWEFANNWNLGAQLNWIGERKRPSNDLRHNLGDYFICTSLNLI